MPAYRLVLDLDVPQEFGGGPRQQPAAVAVAAMGALKASQLRLTAVHVGRKYTGTQAAAALVIDSMRFDPETGELIP
jgi:hypothetical protein